MGKFFTPASCLLPPAPCPLPPAQEFATRIDGCDIMGNCYTNLKTITI